MSMISAGEIDQLGRELRHSLVTDLTQVGALVSARCIDAFLAVPRHVFVPRFLVDREGAGDYEVLDGTDDMRRREWLRYVYSDEPLPTQIEGTNWVSSSSQPSLMAMMLEALSVTGSERVLEIGTGTGYNAALLCEMLGDGQVTSVDIDAGLIDEARERLASAGYHPTLAAVDGIDGYPSGSPYDRVIATCSVERVPLQWAAQTSSEGLMLVNLYRDLGGGALAILRVSEESASGHFAPFFGGFMPTRTRATASGLELLGARREAGSSERSTKTAAAVLQDGDFGMFAALRLSAQSLGLVTEEGQEQFLLLGRDGSWASQTSQDGSLTVVQGGPAKLWDQLERAYDEWTALGRPPREAFGLTVTPRGDHLVWHGSPDGQTWML